MRSLPLTTIKGGINRLRTKGGARPDNLYDLVNGYVTEAGTVKVRPGTERVAELDSRTRGLCAFGGELHVFCHVPVSVPTGYVLNVITHPEPPDDYLYSYEGVAYAADQQLAIDTIHFAEPFLGGLYVVAEFEDGSVYHYWLQPGRTWEAEKEYRVGDLVFPTAANGFLYRASRLGDPYPPWQPDEPRYDGIGDAYAQSAVEPTETNGYYYVCTTTEGPNPRSGLVEPTWPEYEGGTVIERTDTGVPEEVAIDSTTPPPAGSTISTPVTTVAQPDPFERYSLSESDFRTPIQMNEQ